MEQQIELRIIERQRKLESAIQKLTKENNEFKRQINRQAQEREEFDKKIEKYLDLNNKNKELIEEKNIALEKIEELNRLNVNLQDEIDRLKTEKSQLEIKNKSLKESEKKTNPCIESVIKANLNMKQEFQDLNDENEKLDEKVKNLEKDINDLSQTNQKLREEFESLKCEKDQIEKINDKMDGLNTKIAGLNDQLIENKGEDQSELNKALQEQKKLAANLISFQEKRYEKIVKNLKNKLEREKTDRSKLEKDNFRLFSTSRTDMKNQEKKDKSIDELEKKLKETQLKLNKISAERDGHKKHVSILQRKNSNLELNEKLSLTSFIECG
jgi:predicted RNase H-like nuclease (RuvC/YqgF family)